MPSGPAGALAFFNFLIAATTSSIKGASTGIVRSGVAELAAESRSEHMVAGAWFNTFSKCDRQHSKVSLVDRHG